MKKFGPSKFASQVIALGLSPTFLRETGRALPSNLGSELHYLIRAELGRDGIHDDDAAQEVFSRGILQICKFLERRSAAEILDPKAWFTKIFINETHRYLQESKGCRALFPMENEEMVAAEGAPIATDGQALGPIREAIQSLRPSMRRFLSLDLIERRSPAEIQMILGIPTLGAFRRAKLEAFALLKEALLKRL